MNVVVDASVIVKWIFQAPETEENTEQALELLTAIRDGKVSLLQPPHWLDG
jgi:predicted nucleic acid-binding protein